MLDVLVLQPAAKMNGQPYRRRRAGAPLPAGARCDGARGNPKRARIRPGREVYLQEDNLLGFDEVRDPPFVVDAAPHVPQSGPLFAPAGYDREVQDAPVEFAGVDRDVALHDRKRPGM
ncbi:MAG: hypothetical protein BJ554DRAFT_816 [Olpidium bornovanus]|uniref:Uncharacterized protein n=1 Tax=Olpidium bornovanus TaxID=278681 RepID=A0A8H7ZTB6_9FUNG|nr:MAG: hypothetical protein BJ554DRAFT_816 [Olpidium bornovanus]